jgi:hypothetical protein
MPDSPDIRTDNSEGSEGRGVATTRWRGFHYELPEDAVAGAFSQPGQSTEDLDPEIRDHIAERALEGSDLTGFWLAWHLASGFAALERGGWHRATIFRKVCRFRAAFAVHPDEYSFPWIQLDLDAAWSEQLFRRFQSARAAGPSH